MKQPKRCKKCGKILRSENESLLCGYHYKLIDSSRKKGEETHE